MRCSHLCRCPGAPSRWHHRRPKAPPRPPPAGPPALRSRPSAAAAALAGRTRPSWSACGTCRVSAKRSSGTESTSAQGGDHCSWQSHAADSDTPPLPPAAAATCGALAARWSQQEEQPQHGRDSQQPFSREASVLERRAPGAGRGSGAEAQRRTQAAHVAGRRRRRQALLIRALQQPTRKSSLALKP